MSRYKDRPDETNAADSVSVSREWIYNRRSELAAASVGTNRYGYAYDTIGNRLSATVNAETNEYVANCLNQYISLHVSAPLREKNIVYDADGNLTSDGAFEYAYDAENRLVSILPCAPTNGAFAVANHYDHLSRRTQKVVSRFADGEWAWSATHTFIWDGNNIVLEKVVLADSTERICEFFWGADKSGTEQGAGGVGGLLAVSVDGAFYIPCYDHNGNIVLYISETGSIAAQYTYNPYGSVVDSNGNLANVFSFGFSTKYNDREVGLVAYQRRFYSPTLGRWIKRDPIEEEGGENLYGFCGNNPISNYDREGCAYFAIRGLGGYPIVKWSWLVSCPFMKMAVDVAADALNVELVHEQLFFEDGSNVGWGNDAKGLGVGRKIQNEQPDRYVKRDGGYNDCVMGLASEEVNVSHYQLIWIGNRTKCNCQDYADMLRKKYWELMRDPKVRCKCGIGKNP